MFKQDCASFLKTVLHFVLIIFLIQNVSCKLLCPSVCTCTSANKTVKCIAKYKEFISEDVVPFKNMSRIGKCDEILTFDELPHGTENLKVDCFKLTNLSFVQQLKLKSIELTRTNLTQFSLDLLTKSNVLTTVQITNNAIAEVTAMTGNVLQSLHTLNLSSNKIKKLLWRGDTFSSLHTLYLQNNELQETLHISKLLSLNYLDISNNPFIHIFNLSGLHSLTTLVMQNVSFAAQGRYKDSAVLPLNLQILDLQRNSLLVVPSCHALLAGVDNLTHLYLQNNNISMITADTFQADCFRNLRSVSFANNRLIQLEADAFKYLYEIQYLNIARNYLQHVDLVVLKRFIHFQNGLPQHNISLEGNPWSCDCQQNEMLSWLKSLNNSSLQFICYLPHHFKGRKLSSLKSDQLACSKSSLVAIDNATAQEFSSANLLCLSSGLPKPEVHWLSPTNELISIESFAYERKQQELYFLSEYGDQLTIKDVRLHRTGFYRYIHCA